MSLSLEQWMLAFTFMGEYQNETVEICDKLSLSEDDIEKFTEKFEGVLERVTGGDEETYAKQYIEWAIKEMMNEQ